MRTLIFSGSFHDPVAITLMGLLPPLVDCPAATHLTFDNIDQAGLQDNIDLIVVVFPEDSDRTLAVIRRLRQNYDKHLIVVGQASEPKLILRTLQSGADHYLDESDLEAELESALARLSHTKGNHASAGELLAVLSAAGGSGASTVAVNVSAALAKQYQKCCLIDLHPGRGHLDGLLDLKPQFTLADLCLNQARLDRAMFEKTLTRHPAGIHLLSAPPHLMDFRVIDCEGVGQALNLARKIYARVVVDLEDCFHEEQVASLQQATGILLVFRLEFSALRHARRILEHLDRLGVSRRRVRLVANRLGQPNELPPENVVEALGEKIAYFIPNDPKTANGSHNTGIPIVLKDPNSKIAQSLIDLAKVQFGHSPTTMNANKLVAG